MSDTFLSISDAKLDIYCYSYKSFLIFFAQKT